MASLYLPDDLRDFLAPGRRLEYDPARCQPGVVTLVALDQLAVRAVGARIPLSAELADDDPHMGERGYYLVPAVSLVAACQHYRPAGVLLWLPDAEVFATWDDDHRTLWAFPGVGWSQIVADPVPYLNGCWEPERAGAEQLRLWESYEWQP
jgi:hypothetical protein